MRFHSFYKNDSLFFFFFEQMLMFMSFSCVNFGSVEITVGLPAATTVYFLAHVNSHGICASQLLLYLTEADPARNACHFSCALPLIFHPVIKSSSSSSSHCPDFTIRRCNDCNRLVCRVRVVLAHNSSGNLLLTSVGPTGPHGSVSYRMG